MILSVSALVLVHGDVEDPVEGVFDPPMMSGDLVETFGGKLRAEEIVYALAGGLVADLTAALDLADGRQAWPVVLVLEPSDIARERGATDLDAAMAGIDLAVDAVALDLRIVEEQGDIGVQGGLISLEGEQVVAALIDDLPGDLPLAADRIDGDDRALEREHFQELRDCGDLVRLAIDGQLAEHQALVGRPGGDQMQRRAARGAVERPAQGLAVDRHHASGAFGKAPHEGQETVVELDRVEQTKDAAEGVMARDAMVQPQELAQKRLLRATEQRHIRAVLAAAQHCAEGNHQNLLQIVYANKRNCGNGGIF